MGEKVKPKTLPGFMELLPKEQILFNKIKDTIQRTYEKYGFLPLDTPIIEDANVLLAKAGGETEKQIYRFNKGENDLALRFDLTVPLAKYVAKNMGNLTFPFKRYQIGKVYRGERAQRGRYREFYQCDIDIIGDGNLSIVNDAELPLVIYDIFSELKFGDFTICINNRKLLNGLFSSLNLQEKNAEILRIIDKIEKIGENSVKRELLEFATEEQINKIIEFIKIDGNNEEKIEKLENLGISDDIFNKGLNELKELIKYIGLFGMPDKNYKIDLTIARGLDYYTGTVFETFLNKYKNLGSICSGGRYDDLASYYTDKKMPGVGISIGLSRLFFQLIDSDIVSAENESITDVLVISMTEDYDKCIEISSKLRENDINTLLNIENQKLGKKFKYADKLNIKYVIVIGEDEIKNNVVSLKNMVSGEQQTIDLENAIKIIKEG